MRTTKKAKGYTDSFGARAPPKNLLPPYEAEVIDFILDQHWNPASKYWGDYELKGRMEKGFYNRMQEAYGPAFIEYMELHTTEALYHKPIIYSPGDIEARGAPPEKTRKFKGKTYKI